MLSSSCRATVLFPYAGTPNVICPISTPPKMNARKWVNVSAAVALLLSSTGQCTHCMCLYGFFESNSKVWSVVVVCGGHLSFLGPRNSPMMDIVVFLCSANRQQCVLWLTVCSWWTTSNIPLNACAHSYQKPWNSSNFAGNEIKFV